MTDKKKPKKFMNERKPRKTTKPKPVEKPKTIAGQVIEEHLNGMLTPQIAQLLNVRVNFVTKVLYLYKQSEKSIVRPLVEANKQANELIQTVADTLQEKPEEQTETKTATGMKWDENEWKTTDEEIAIPKIEKPSPSKPKAEIDRQSKPEPELDESLARASLTSYKAGRFQTAEEILDELKEEDEKEEIETGLGLWVQEEEEKEVEEEEKKKDYSQDGDDVDIVVG